MIFVRIPLLSQELPYPIIFIHGLNSSNKTSDIYVVNFDTWWNENPNSPMIYLNTDIYDVSTGESKSNQSSIVKQGYALGRFIKEIINQTGAQKVILVGHSMGGLCAREYLQRRENGKPKWWYDPNSPDGHRVAKLVTIGTPHLGSNSGNFIPIADKKNKSDEIQMINTSSEAVRDLRYSYIAGDGGVGRYLFGGPESGLTSLPSYLGGWHNRDINCNGTEDDLILGINTELDKSLPLPRNIAYHWITSDVSFTNGDRIVDLDRQWIRTVNNMPYPYGITDTTLTDKMHTNEPQDFYSILRGLDEPQQKILSYNLEIGKTYIGFRNYLMNYNLHDTDSYKIDISKLNIENGLLTINYNDLLNQTYTLSPCKIILWDSNEYYVMDTTFTNEIEQNNIYLDESMLAKFKGLMYLEIIADAFSDNDYLPYNAPYNITTTFKIISDVEDQTNDNKIELGISPNPASDNISISFSNSDFTNTSISIYNYLGIEIKKFDEMKLFGQSSINFSMKEFNPGFYFCTLKCGIGNVTKSFILYK